MTDIGHNSGGIAAEALRQYVERVERLREEIKALNEDVAEVYKEAKAMGFQVKAIKAIVAERAKDPSELREFEEILDLYRAAINGASCTYTRGQE